MAYTAGDLILDDEYNTFATGNADGTANHAVANINSIWGTGNADKGYGQSTTLSAVSAGTVITATQWSTMIARLNSIRTHQTGSASGITSPTTGDVVEALGTLSSTISTAYTNRSSANTQGTPASTNHDAVWNTATPTTFQQVRTIEWSSADAARYWFNSGGTVAVTLSVAAGGGGNTKETRWGELLASVGTITLGFTTSTRSGSGNTLTTNGLANGYWDLTTSNVVLLKLTEDTSPYTANTVEVRARVAGAAGSNGGKGTQVIFDILYTDGAGDSFDDALNFTLRAATTRTPPETTNLTDVWGTPTSTATTN